MDETSGALARRAHDADVLLLAQAGSGMKICGADVGAVVALLRDERDGLVKDCEALAAANARLERERDGWIEASVRMQKQRDAALARAEDQP